MPYYMPDSSSIRDVQVRNHTPDASHGCKPNIAHPQMQSDCEWTTEVSTGEPRFDHKSHGSFAAQGLKGGRHG